MLHGWGMHSAFWSDVLPTLSARYTVHLVDLPGHGINRDSAVPLQPEAVVSAIAARVPAAGIWMGWSLGGLLALHAALRHPGLVQRLVMVSSTARFVAAPDWPLGVPVDVFQGFAAALSEDLTGTIQRFLALETLGLEHAREALQGLSTLLAQRPAARLDALRKGLALLEHTDDRDALPKLCMPVLWLGGKRDRLVHPDALQELAALCPEATLRVIPAAAHAPFVSAPQVFMQYCRDFIDS